MPDRPTNYRDILFRLRHLTTNIILDVITIPAIAAALALACPLCAQAIDFDALSAPLSAGAEIPPIPEPGRPDAERSPAKEWTVLVYISARNSLGIEAIKDVNEMEEAGSGDRVNVVVEMGRIPTAPLYDPFTDTSEPRPMQNDWTGSRRFLIARDADPLRITSPVLAYLPDADMGDWNHLAEFITWGKARFPAKKYLLIVGGHGSGWRGVKSPAANKGISYDEVSKNHIAPAELAMAVERGGGVDVYASDACLMQTAEFIYELRGSAEFVVGSQESTPGTGYDYARLLNSVSRAPGGARETALQVVDAFLESHSGKSVTISAVSARRAGELAELLNAFARLVLESPPDRRLYRENKFRLRSFDDEDSRDLYQLMSLYYDRSDTPAVKEQAAAVMRFLTGTFVAQNGAAGRKSKDANGVSIYFPLSWLSYKETYGRLSFSADTAWDDMLKAVLFEKT